MLQIYSGFIHIVSFKNRQLLKMLNLTQKIFAMCME